MANKRGHTPQFPQYLPQGITQRNLYFLGEKGKTVYDKKGTAFAVPEYADLVDFLFTHNGLVFTTSFTNTKKFPHLDAAIADARTQVHCQKAGKATSITINGGRAGNRKISNATLFNEKYKKQPLDVDFLLHQEELYRICGVGTHATYGAIGKALMLQSWQQEPELRPFYKHRHTAPNQTCQEFLWHHHVGGRCDTPGLGNFYNEAIELDMSSAYLAHFMTHPTGIGGSYGAGCFFLGESGASHYVTYFVECDVHIPGALPLGPFPIKVGKYGAIKYPNTPGTYRAYLWREQIVDCVRAGCDVHIIRGYGWKDFTTDNRRWAQNLYARRMEVYGTEFERDLKSIIVAGIGRHGMRSTFYHLSLRDETKKAEILVGDNHKATKYFIIASTDYAQAAMTHWYDYTIMQCNRSLYLYSLQPAIEGRLIMTNYDALLVTELNESTLYPEKHTLAAKMVACGDLRWQKLTNVKILAPRSLDCDQKTIRPGVPLEERAA